MESSGNKTPKKMTDQLRDTPKSTPKSTSSLARFVLLSNNSSFTPSPSLANRVVRNPFESHQLHERLHLPVISSPSLFQERPTEKFQWSIDELSNLNPVNLVPHDTQFQENIDPQREAQAQAAIRSFFTDQIIVPSPQDCSLRNHKIIFKSEICSEIVNSTSMSNCEASTPSRGTATQTDLTFPPVLPKEVEDCLRKYQLFNNDEKHENDDDTLSSTADRSFIDISTLRRKLFINPHPETPELPQSRPDLSPAPRTPQLHSVKPFPPGERMDSSFENDMFGELSPIQPENCSSFNDVSMLSENQTPNRKSRLKPIARGKNLSTSFNLLKSSPESKENVVLSLDSMPKRFGRFDSGFLGDEDSKFAQILNPYDFMQI